MVLAGKYRILRSLGKGGEGSVCLAVHLQTEQLWAIKKIVRGSDGWEFHELNMMKKLHHRGLPKIVDVLEEEDSIYLVMEYVRGHTLEEVKQKKGRLVPEQVLETGLQISQILCYLHSRPFPIFHLDVKPANIIQEQDGRLVLVDFGSAWKKQDSEILRRGTDGFAAPEQYDMERPVDGRTDIYGLGATMYYLISGVTYSPVLVKSKIPGCPEYLAEVIRKCVQEDQELRYADCRSLHRRLEKQKKKAQGGKKRRKVVTALFFALFVSGIAGREVSKELLQGNAEKWNYEKLLSEALCSVEEERLEYYYRALFCAPGRKEAYLQYLLQASSDGIFSRSEEEEIRAMLHTIPLGKDETYEELLAKNPASYGEVTFQLGLIYWYCYEGDEGKQIAGGWFSKADTSLEKLPEKREKKEWERQTKAFANRSTYFERLSIKTEREEHPELLIQYWEDLQQSLDFDGQSEKQKISELRFLQETLGQMAFLAEEWRQCGIGKEEQKELVKKILRQAESLSLDGVQSVLEQKLTEEIRIQADTVKQIIENLSDGERG